MLIAMLLSLALGPITALTATAGAQPPAGPQPPGPPVRVATLNICKSTCGPGRYGWENRRLALVRTVAQASPDVLAVQEANTQLWHGIRHIDDVISLLAPLGYQIAGTDFSGCPAGCTRGTHIFFRTDAMQLAGIPAVPAGMTSMAQIAGASLGGIQDRAVSWAFLSPVGSAAVTLFLSVHLATQKTAQGEAARTAVAAALRPWAAALSSASGHPGANLVVAGDLNSYQRRQPYGAQRLLTDAGLIDGFSAPVRVNADISSVNYAPAIAKHKGFPPRPFRYRRNTTHIDYVLASVQPVRHEVVVHLTADGRFDDAFRVSDHNMVIVDLPLRATG